MKRAAIYVRVSTTNRTRGGDAFEQNPEVQEIPLRQFPNPRFRSFAALLRCGHKLSDLLTLVAISLESGADSSCGFLGLWE